MIERRHLLLGAAALPFVPYAARAQGQQQRYASINMFIPAGPGGGWDGLGRAIEQVARATGMVGAMQFENVGGAGGVVGLPRFVQQRRGRPDALLIAGAVMVGATLTNRSPVGMKDIVPLARMTDEVGVIVVPANSEFRDIRGLLDALRENPGAVAVGGGSAGGVDHILLGQMIKALGRNAREASYVAFAGGGPAQAAILGGQVRAGISGFSEFAEQIKAGRMRALATSGETRSDPAIPTLKESGLDLTSGNWRGVFGPPGLSAEAKQKHVEFLTALHATPQWRELVQTRGWDDAFMPAPAFEAFIRRDEEATAAVLRDIGLAS